MKKFLSRDHIVHLLRSTATLCLFFGIFAEVDQSLDGLVPILEDHIMAQDIKVGDTIRYLNAAGGGVVKRIERGVAWVMGSDGFEMPTPLHECVVVNSQDTFVPSYKNPLQKKAESSAKAVKSTSQSLSTVAPSTDKAADLSFLVPTTEGPFFDRAGGDKINVSVAFLPLSYERFGEEPFECYLINESNYHLLFSYTTQSESGKSKQHSAGVLEPDMRVLVEVFSPDNVSEHEVCRFQFIPYKPERTFTPIPPVEAEVRIDTVKFFKRHAFKGNVFFDEDAMVYPLLRDYEGVKTSAPSAIATAPSAGRAGTIQEKKKSSKAAPVSTTTTSKEPAAPTETSSIPRQPVEQVGIEADRLLPDSSGMTPHEVLLYQLKTFRRELDKRLGRKGCRVVFVHGAGQGILHQLIINNIEQSYPMVEYRDMTFDGFATGAIEVSIKE